MIPFLKNTAWSAFFPMAVMIFIVASLTLNAFSGASFAEGTRQKSPLKTFTSPEKAAIALVDAVRDDNAKELQAILGPEGRQLISLDDELADRSEQERFVRMYSERNQVVREGHRKAVLEVGSEGWPLPIPIVRAGANWHFDAREGEKEILNRGIGKNELSAILVCLAYVDAQREYAEEDWTGEGLFQYAQKLVSEPGKEDGLYWETREGEEPSPLGPLVAHAQKENSKGGEPDENSSPYHGYFYKILKAQGKSAPGGAREYVVRGRMIGGFALVAYPAVYGSSGIMTFMVNQEGIVYEKDLGRKTESAVQAMESFNPDRTWRKVKPKDDLSREGAAPL